MYMNKYYAFKFICTFLFYSKSKIYSGEKIA